MLAFSLLPHDPMSAVTTATWKGLITPDTWSTSGEWTGGTPPNGSDDVANFTDATTVTGSLIVNMDTPITLGTLNINATTNGYTIQPVLITDVLTFNASSLAPTITNSGGGFVQLVYCPITVTSGQTLVAEISSGTQLNLQTTIIADNVQMSGTSGGTLVINGTASNTGLTLLECLKGQVIIGTSPSTMSTNKLKIGDLTDGSIVAHNQNNQLYDGVNIADVEMTNGTWNLNGLMQTVDDFTFNGGSMNNGTGGDLKIKGQLKMFDNTTIGNNFNLILDTGSSVFYTGSTTTATIASTVDLNAGTRPFWGNWRDRDEYQRRYF